MNQKLIVELLRTEVIPASGCTEPGAVALAAACASEQLNGIVDTIHITVNSNIFKNGVAAGIPGTGETGLHIAAALGAIKRHSEKQLLVLEDVELEDLKAAQVMVRNDRVSVEVDESKSGLWIKALLYSGANWSEVLIEDKHTNITSIQKNGIDSVNKKQKVGEINRDFRAFLKKDGVELAELIDTVEKMPVEDLAFLKEGVDMNVYAAEQGLLHSRGLGIGKSYSDMIATGVLADDVINYARMMTAAAADVRMSGENVKIMSSAGSGNHGITAILPVYAVAKRQGASEEQLIRAIAMSHLITIYVKIHTGNLSALCGCAVAAATGAGAAITWLMGGKIAEMEAAIQMIIANLTGMICDGGKVGCALKLSTAASAAVESALLARRNTVVPVSNGIMGKTVECTIKNLGKVSNPGMLETDKVVMKVMLSKEDDATTARSKKHASKLLVR